MNCQKQIVVRLVSSLVLFTLLVGIHNFSNYSFRYCREQKILVVNVLSKFG
jgi:hypothetical protein